MASDGVEKGSIPNKASWVELGSNTGCTAGGEFVLGISVRDAEGDGVERIEDGTVGE